MSINSEVASDAIAITPNDTTSITPCRALYVGGAGDVKVVMWGNSGGGGATVTFAAVPAGSVLPVAVTKVLATGTTATNIVGLR